MGCPTKIWSKTAIVSSAFARYLRKSRLMTLSLIHFAEIRAKFGMHHGLFFFISFDKLWAQTRSKGRGEKDELSEKIEKISDFSSKTESLLGPADVGPPGLSRL